MSFSPKKRAWFSWLKHSPRRKPRTIRLSLEALEDRMVPSASGVNVLSSSTGLDFNAGAADPPDTNGAAGPNIYVETVNQAIAIYNKSTRVRDLSNATIATDSLSDFFFTRGGLAHVSQFDLQSDSFTTYDPLVNRFIVGNLEIALDPNTGQYGPANALLLAVSKTSDPTTLTSSDWYFYEVSTTQSGVGVQDYPGNVGYNADALVITQNSFDPTGTTFLHTLINTISISALTSGAPLTLGTNYFQNDYNGASLRPTVMHDSKAGDPMWFVQEGGNDASINVIKMSNVLSNTPQFFMTNLAVNPYDKAVPELQPDGSAITSKTDSRIMKAAMENGLIVAAHQVSDANGDLDKIQWYVIDTAGSRPSLQQQGDVSGGPGTYYAYPGIDINSQGVIGMSYIASGTGAGQYMSVYVSGRTPTDPAGTMASPVLVQAGQANYFDVYSIFGGREGDLSGISVDSDGSFWVANEFANTEFGANWGTAIAHFTMVSAPMPSPPVPSPPSAPSPPPAPSSPPSPPSPIQLFLDGINLAIDLFEPGGLSTALANAALVYDIDTAPGGIFNPYLDAGFFAALSML